ncbi:MAG: lysophospholipid acyltransferase family protein [Phycisphaeraceae bacterium]|nr:lysophospholipid acyltransferase family protein [Phycisphaeraceae bacterium]
MATKKPLHPALEHPITAAIRGVMSVPLIAGLGPAMAAARGLGALYPSISPSRFRRAVANLEDAFPEWSPAQRHECAVASYQHLFQIGVEVLFAPRLITPEGFTNHLYFTHVESAVRTLLKQGPCILISGHCGNWELIGSAISMLGFPMHAVYRPLDLRPLDAWLYETRARRGLTLVSKFGAVRSLPPVLRRGEPVGLVADQSGGDRGLFTPFFGRLTSTYKSIGLLAMQTNARIICGFARRLRDDEDPPPGPWAGTVDRRPRSRSPMRYSVELVDQFGPEDWVAQPDPLYYLTARYRRAIEQMVRRAPEQYFWMHRIWRSRPAHERLNKPFPPHLRDKLDSLPWMSAGDVDAIVQRSEQDRAAIAAGKGL